MHPILAQEYVRYETQRRLREAEQRRQARHVPRPQQARGATAARTGSWRAALRRLLRGLRGTQVQAATGRPATGRVQPETGRSAVPASAVPAVGQRQHATVSATGQRQHATVPAQRRPGTAAARSAGTGAGAHATAPERAGARSPDPWPEPEPETERVRRRLLLTAGRH